MTVRQPVDNIPCLGGGGPGASLVVRIRPCPSTSSGRSSPTRLSSRQVEGSTRNPGPAGETVRWPLATSQARTFDRRTPLRQFSYDTQVITSGVRHSAACATLHVTRRSPRSDTCPYSGRTSGRRSTARAAAAPSTEPATDGSGSAEGAAEAGGDADEPRGVLDGSGRSPSGGRSPVHPAIITATSPAATTQALRRWTLTGPPPVPVTLGPIIHLTRPLCPASSGGPGCTVRVVSLSAGRSGVSWALSRPCGWRRDR